MSRSIKAVVALLAAAIAAGALVALNSKEPKDPGAFPYRLTDDDGVRTTIPRRPERIVTLGPHFTETLFRLGLGDAVVGIAGGETTPAEATTLPTVLNEDGSPNTVRIGELAPDLVIAAGSDHGGYRQRLRQAGIDVVTLKAVSIDDAIADMVTVGRLTGRTGRAETMVAGIRSALASARVTQGKAKVFVEILYPPLTSAGTGGYLSSVVSAAGGVLVAPSQAQTTPDAVAALAPEIYLVASSDPVDVGSRPGYAAISAVKSGRVRTVPEDLLLYPGPRLVEAVRAVASALRTG